MTRVTLGQTSRWTGTITLAAAALLTLPIAAQGRPGQTSSAPSVPPAAEQSVPPAVEQSSVEQSSDDTRETATKQRALAQEHLRKAGEALSDMPDAALPTDVQARVADVNRRITALQHDDAAARDDASTAAGDRRRAELAAIERTLSALLGPDSATGTPTVQGDVAVGTAGVPAPTLDESTRAKLEQVRTHMTAYAAAMGSAEHTTETAGAPADPADPTAVPSGSAAPPTAESATASTSPTDPTPTPTGTSPAALPETPAAPDAGDDGNRRAGAETSRRHLTAARNTLSQMTQLPAAAELTGEARAQVSQLITQFNELITADGEWRASLDKVKASLARVMNGDPRAVPTTGADATAADAPEARVVTLGPEIREKLIEFRIQLDAFERAASRGPDTGDHAPAAGVESSSPSGATAEPGGVAARVSDTDPAAGSGSTSTGSPIAGMPGPAADTSASPPPAGAAERDDSIAAAVPNEALRHIEAIEAILGRHGQTSADRPTGTSGTDPSAGTGAMLDASQVLEIREHLSELRRLVESRGP